MITFEEQDVQRIRAHPLVMIGSDGIPEDTHPDPRLWGSFPPSARSLCPRSRSADLVVFDPVTVADRATFDKLIAAAVGIELLLVNGGIAYDPSERLKAEGCSRFLQRAAAA